MTEHQVDKIEDRQQRGVGSLVTTKRDSAISSRINLMVLDTEAKRQFQVRSQAAKALVRTLTFGIRKGETGWLSWERGARESMQR